MKSARQAAVVELIDREAITSQDQLRRRLRARGLEATQATISRDLKELGVVKRAADGAYEVLARETLTPGLAEASLRRAVAEFLRGLEQVQQLIVLKTNPGQAQIVALAIDRAQLPGAVGTIAGDDTILLIARDVRRARALVARFGQMITGE